MLTKFVKVKKRDQHHQPERPQWRDEIDEMDLTCCNLVKRRARSHGTKWKPKERDDPHRFHHSQFTVRGDPPELLHPPLHPTRDDPHGAQEGLRRASPGRSGLEWSLCTSRRLPSRSRSTWFSWRSSRK